MTTKDRIRTVLNQFNRDMKGQANFASEHLRDCMTEAIYDAVMKQDSYANSSTYNDEHTGTQLVFFSNLEDKETK
jgi:hypothetical protein